MPRKPAKPIENAADSRANPFELAAVVAECVELIDVHVVDCKAGPAHAPAAEGPRDRMVPIEVAYRVEGRRLEIRQRFIAATPPVADNQGGDTLAIDCTLQLTYELATDPAEVPEASIEAFAHINGLFNAWPYWREFAQNLAARMDRPGFVLPVFRFQDIAKAGDEADEDRETRSPPTKAARGRKRG